MPISVVVGIGPNDVTIPLLVFPDTDAAIARLTELGVDVQERSWANLNESELEEEVSPLRDGLFTGYYGGCGDCYAIRIKEVEFGVPFVNWNLD